MTQWPSMPAPLNSTGPGEAWVWGDYMLLLQDYPNTLADMMCQMTGTPLESPPLLEYPYAVTAYYRQDKNPHGPSARPILIAGLEKMDYVKAAALMGLEDLDLTLPPPSESLPVLGIFTASSHLNMGPYNGPMDVDSVRERLFSAIADHIHPTGEPAHIGPISAIHGHPDTGWPALKKKKKGGCLSLVVATLALATCCAWLFSRVKLPLAQVISPSLATAHAHPAPAPGVR